MNESQSQSSSNGENRQKDIQKLHQMWKNIKNAKNKEKQQSKNNQKREKSERQSNKKSIGSVKNAIHQQQQKNLQARLAMTQKQLSRSRQNTALLMAKLSQSQQELQLLSFELQKERKDKQQRLLEIEQLRYQMLQLQKQGTFGQQKQVNETLRQEIQIWKSKCEMKDKQIDRLSLRIKSLQLDKANQDTTIRNLSQLNDAYKRQISDTEIAINQMYLGDQSKGAQLLQLDEANKTIQRLVQLLRATEEFHNFGNFAEDVKELHFMKNIPKRLKSNMLNHPLPERKKMCSCMDVKIEERLLWTSAASYKIMLDMKMKYDSLTEDCIQEALFELNKIWLAREESHVRRVKQAFNEQLGRLKKKGQIRYDQLVARKQIQRLKKQLQGAKNFKKGNKTLDIQNLKSLGQYEDELRLREKQVRLLHERIRLIETETNNSDKVLYMQGALWIIDKVISEMENNEEDIRQFEVRFREKIEENLDQEDWIRSYKQFFENITEIQNVLMEKLFMMKESTLKKMGNQKILGKDSLAGQLNKRH